MKHPLVYAKQYRHFFPYIVFFASLVATLSSIFFSEVMKLPPCVLCWYQRVFMYPLVLITAVGIIKKNKELPLYILPLSIIGWLIALYHNLLYYGIIPEVMAPCVEGVSCTQRLLQVFGFIDIPLGSFLAFTFINICSIIDLLAQKKK